MTGFRGMHSSNGASLLGLAVLTIWVGACGGGGGSKADAGATGTPTELCTRLATTICTRAQSCNVASATFVQATCVMRDTVAFGCDRATSANFPACVNDVEAISCAGLFSPTAGLILPPSCDDPINTIPLSDSQSKCDDLAVADCQWGAACLGITPTAAQLQACEVDDFSTNNCLFTTAVGATYDQCLADIPKAPCPPADGGASTGTDASALPSCDNALIYVN
jgi:hypothetical protein